MSKTNKSSAIRLTNRTARALREQAKREQYVLRLTVVVFSFAMAVLAVAMGIIHIAYVPVIATITLLADGLLLTFARGRYVELSGQAICTEAAARSLDGQKSEEERRRQARMDLEKIKEDLAAKTMGDDHKGAEEEEKEDDEEDEDIAPAFAVRREREPARGYAQAGGDTRPVNRKSAVGETAPDAEKPAARRRRQANLTLISGDN